MSKQAQIHAFVRSGGKEVIAFAFFHDGLKEFLIANDLVDMDVDEFNNTVASECRIETLTKVASARQIASDWEAMKKTPISDQQEVMTKYYTSLDTAFISLVPGTKEFHIKKIIAKNIDGE